MPPVSSSALEAESGEVGSPRSQLRRQCSLLFLARSNLYYHPRGESAEKLVFMENIDRQFLETSWYGSGQMARHMQGDGHKCGRHRVRRLMRPMRLVPIYQEPKTGKKHPEHKIYPYLLKGLAITRPDQVWCRRHQLHSDAPGLSLPRRDYGPEQPKCSADGYRIPWTPGSASRPCRKHWPDAARRRYSTPITVAAHLQRLQRGTVCDAAESFPVHLVPPWL
ncbi:IS3 family transposase [Cribrihabitans pelagius]|uniref:IS3 family transposase n=1 Tax=Cribrihabitans pelagius TaxID=1765746 RepID=UPI003B58F873